MLVPVPHSSIRSDIPPPSFSGCNAYHRNLDLHSQCQGNHTPTFAAQLKKNVYPRYKHSSTVSVHILLYRTQHSSPSLPSLPFPSLHTDAGRESLHVMFNFLSHNLLMIQGKENNQTAQSSITSGVQSKSKKKEPEQNRTAGDCAVWCCVIILLAPYHPCTVARTRTMRKKREKTNQVRSQAPH